MIMVDWRALSVSRALRRSPGLACAGLAAALLAPAPAVAQVKDIEPRALTVTTDGISLRSGAGDVWYVVGIARSGDVLTADGESYGWYRVRYPAGTPALVLASEATLDQGRSVVKLTGPSKLLAYAIGASTQNAAAVQASWKNLLNQPLQPGTELRHVQTLSDAAGKAVAYLVNAPDGARAFVNSQAVREATEAEKSSVKAAGPGPIPVAQTPQAAPAEAQPATTAPSTPPPAATTAASEPAPSVQPAGEQAAPTTMAMTPPGGGSEARSDDPIGRRIAKFDDLEPTYRKVVSEPIGSAELDPLISEYKRLEESLGDAPEDAALRPAVQSRMNLLQIRADLQKDFQRLTALESKAKTDVSEIGEKIKAYQASKPYSVVGRLTASTIYDGQKLPLMFRLQSVEGDIGRTLAYVVATPGVDVMGKIGLLVGVEGDARRDPALRLDIIEARRVDVLTSADQPGSGTTPPTQPEAARELPPASPQQTAGDGGDGN
jgi:hypothetical protein